MPTVEKTKGGRVSVRGIGDFVPGEPVEVSDDDAEYLCDERGDFTVVDDAGDDDVFQEDGMSDDQERDIDMRSRSDLESVDHDSLKQFAGHLGIAEETDLRSKEAIIDAILDETREG